MNGIAKLEILTLSLLLTFTMATLPAHAANVDAGWQVRIAGIQIDPNVSFTDQDDGDLVTVGSDNGNGFDLSLERRFTPRLGLEFGALSGKPDLTLDARLGDGTQFSARDGVRFLAAYAAFNVHLSPNSAVDLYLGPMVAQVFFGDVGFSAQVSGGAFAQTFLSDDDLALGAQIGADIAFGESHWSLHLSVKYFDTTLAVANEAGERTSLDFDSTVLGVGFGYRF